MIIKLMDYTDTFTKEVEINEGDEVEIAVLSGDWFMESPTVVDSSDDRTMSWFDGRVSFIATKNNIDKVNNCKSSYEIFDLEFEEVKQNDI